MSGDPSNGGDPAPGDNGSGQPQKTIEQLDKELDALEGLKKDIAEDVASGKMTQTEAERALQGIEQEITELTEQIIEILGGGMPPIP